MTVLKLILGLLRSMLGSRAVLAAENLALRQQLAVLRRSVNKQGPSYAIRPKDAFLGMDNRPADVELDIVGMGAHRPERAIDANFQNRFAGR